MIGVVSTLIKLVQTLTADCFHTFIVVLYCLLKLIIFKPEEQIDPMIIGKSVIMHREIRNLA